MRARLLSVRRLKVGLTRLSRLATVAMIALALAPGPARASFFDTFGFGARGTAMGNAMTASARDYHAIYYNPAQLMERPEVHVGIGLTLLEPILQIDRTRQESAQSSILPGRNLGIHLGVSSPLGGVFRNKLAFGVGFFVPLLRVTRAEFRDPKRPQYYMYESLPDKLIIGAGLAGKPFPWWKIGIGVQVLADLDGRADITLSLVERRITRRRLSIDLHSDAALTAGMTFTPIEGLNLAVSYRQALDLVFQLPVKANLKELGLLDFFISGTNLYTPHQLNVGGSWRLPWLPLQVSADLTWALWSRAPSPAPNVRLRLGVEALTGNPDHRPLIDVASAHVSLQSKDVLIPRVGLEYTLGAFELRAGYVFRPTPIPAQTGGTNYVDSDAHVASLGASWTFQDPTRVHKRPLTIGIAFQATVLRPRRIEKTDPADPTGPYTASGALFGLSLDFQHDF